MCLVGELVFARERVGVQPVEQLFAVGANHPGLWEMDMGVDKARGNQRIAVEGNVSVGRQRGKQVCGIAQRGDFAVLDHQQAIFKILVGGLDPDFGGVGDAVQNGGAIGFTGHNNSQCVAWLRREDATNCVRGSAPIGSAQAVCWPKWAL